MQTDREKIYHLAEALKELVKFEPVSKDELKEWYAMARTIVDDRDVSLAWPHFLWHYLSDADIRMKDAVYAEMQNERISHLIEYLNCGVMPSDEDI